MLSLTINVIILIISGITETIIPGVNVNMAAEVGLLTRNVKIIGEDYPKLQKQAFGARVLVGKYSNGGDEYIGEIFCLFGGLNILKMNLEIKVGEW